MKLRKPCEHGKYDDHIGLLYEEPYERCPGGVFLPDDTLVVEKVDGEWPDRVCLTLRGWVTNVGPIKGWDIDDHLIERVLDELASQEPS